MNSELQKEEMQALLNSGVSFREVARRFDMNRESLRRLALHWNEEE